MDKPLNYPVWLYSRSSSSHPIVLFSQMNALREAAERWGYIVIGSSQDMGSGRSINRMGLRLMMNAVRNGSIRAVVVRNLSRFSHDPLVLTEILKFLLDHGVDVITVEGTLRTEPDLRITVTEKI